MIEIPSDWGLDVESSPLARKYAEMISSQARRLARELAQNVDDQEKQKKIITNYYKKFLTMILTKESKSIGINKSPTRDYILDYPWIVCGMDRFMCSKIWDKVDP